MSTVSKVIITIVVVAVVVLGGWWLIASMSNTANDPSNDTQSQNEGTNEPENEQAAVATITFTGSEFTPASTTVQAGDVIKIVNDSQETIYFASDEHPTHLDNSELNVGDIEPGSSATFSISSAGIWGYHDHYNASMKGEITVQ